MFIMLRFRQIKNPVRGGQIDCCQVYGQQQGYLACNASDTLRRNDDLRQLAARESERHSMSGCVGGIWTEKREGTYRGKAWRGVEGSIVLHRSGGTGARCSVPARIAPGSPFHSDLSPPQVPRRYSHKPGCPQIRGQATIASRE